MKNTSKNIGRVQRKKRIRAKVSGTSVKPRLAVFKSLKGIYVQVIDDTVGKTLVAGRLAEVKKKGNTIEGSFEVGKLVAKKCAELKITTVVFDRGGYQYHGKIKAVADGAREGGLNF